MVKRNLFLTSLSLCAFTAFTASSATAGYDNPSDDAFYEAANAARVSIADIRKVYACWHSNLGAGHTYTHSQILAGAMATIQKAYLEGHTGRGESVEEALRLCRSTD